MRGVQRNEKAKYLALTLVSIILIGSPAAFGANNNSGNIAADKYTGNNTASANAPTSGEKNTEPEAKVKLTFWTMGDMNYEELANTYMKEHPNVTIKVQNTGDTNAHHNKLAAAFSAGSGTPDIFQLEAGFMEHYLGVQDKFYNLNDLGAKDIQTDFLKWKWKQASSVDGSFQLGLPADIGPTVVYYRTDLAEAAGLPGDPEGFSAAIDTWDKFAAVAKDFKEITGKYFSDLTDLTFNALRDQSVDEIYFSRTDGTFFGDTNPYVKRAYDFTVKGIQEGWISNSEIWSPEWEQGMNDGSFAVVIGPAWLAGKIKSSAPDSSGKWRIAQLSEGVGNWGGSFITLPKEGKHPKEAYEFIQWLVNKENQLESFKTKGLIPSTPALYEDPAFADFKDEFFGGQQTAVEFGKAANRVKWVYYGPLHDKADTFFKNALRNVSEKKADPAKEWNYAVKQAKTLAPPG